MLEQFKDDYELFHSSFQIEHFILVKNGKTPYGIYKQCLRELISRESSLRTLYAQKMKQEIAFEELALKISACDGGSGSIEVRRLRIDEAELAYGAKDILKVISETEREYTQFYNAAVLLKKKLGDLTKDRRELLEKQLWVEMCKFNACKDFMTIGTVSVETTETVLSLPTKDMQTLIAFFAMLKSPQGAQELNKFVDTYSRNFDFGTSLDRNLEFNIKALVEDNGSRDQ